MRREHALLAASGSLGEVGERGLREDGGEVAGPGPGSGSRGEMGKLTLASFMVILITTLK